MEHRRFSSPWLTLVLAAGFAIAGCGGGGSNDAGGDGSPSLDGGEQDGFDHRGTADDPARFAGPLEPARNLSSLLLEDLVIGELLPAASLETTDEERLATATRCLGGSLNILVGAPETAIMAILGELDNGRLPDPGAVIQGTGARLDNGVNRLTDSLLLALGGKGYCGEGVELETAMPGTAASELLALARSGAFSDAATGTELRMLLDELSALTGRAVEELAQHPGLHPIYLDSLGVLPPTTADVRDAYNAVLAPAPDLLSLEQATGQLVENLLRGLIADMLPLASLAGEGRVDGAAYTEVENLLSGSGSSLTGGTPGSARPVLEQSMATLMRKLLAENADILTEPPEDGRLLSALQGNGDDGPLTRLLQQLLDIVRAGGTAPAPGS